ncbi:unnamed protein product [Trichogramma brassicae]|uniref:Uncharacterized protein n=1 Tax=Trichogramma brassicae TaxID=86971 RepID=A0A6H5I5Z6_9HYME|nr:unnamed protein product [Trichogramma brassicae]
MVDMNMMVNLFEDSDDSFDGNGYELEEVDRRNQETLERLRRECENFNWERVEQRYSFYCGVVDLTLGWIYHWDRYLPDVRDIFTLEQIDYLLKESVINRLDHLRLQGEQFIKFVLRAHYKDQPDVDEDGRPSSRRTTALHHVSADDTSFRVVSDLFDIYDRLDVNYADESGLTHFHVACQFGCYDTVDEFLRLGQDPNLLVRETGDSPLHFAVKAEFNGRTVIESLLRKGADPNLANKEGSTALHEICKADYDQNTVNAFFELSSENNHSVLIDARDVRGNTPLHSALAYGNKRATELLLRKGADSSLANAEGLTTLHIICKRIKDDDLVDFFFNIHDDLQQTVRIDVLDNEGMTPLKWAVVNLLPHVLDVLLDRGADISNFAFPAEDYFYESLEDYEWNASELLRQASGILSVVERLERRGYELDRKGAITITKFFAKNRLFLYPEYPAELESCWRSEAFVRTARGIMIKSNLSLYDLMRLRPEEAENRVTYMEYFELACTKKLEVFPVWSHLNPCVLHLCEKLARGFFRRWAIFCLAGSMFDRLPVLCRDAIVDLLTNEDLGASSPPPNLRDIFRAEAIDYFLTEAVMYRDSDCERAEQFIRFVSASGYKAEPTDLNQYGRPSPRRTTLVHRAIGKNWDSTVIKYLMRFYDGCDVNYVDESGLTHFHVACWKGYNDLVQRFLDYGRVDPNDRLWRGQSPLYLAVRGGHDNVIASLLRGGADPSSVDAAGRTALHYVCELWGRDRLASIIFELGRENNHRVLIDARDNEGNAPLLLAVSKGNFQSLGEFLLRKGADPNLANAEGSTALHEICKRDYEQDLVNAFFELSRENNHPVLINAQDNGGNTALHWAAGKGNKKLVEYLLRRGADSSLANAEGKTALHVICKRDKEDDLIDTYFNVCAEVNQAVQVDAEDNFRVTPLEWAVTRFRPHVVDVLLNRGADITDFVFPEEDVFSGSKEDICRNASLLRRASGALACVELLEARGYAMKLAEALRLMKIFAFNAIYEQPLDRARFRHCRRNEQFQRQAREIMMSSDVSLYDAMQTRAELAEDRLNYMDYYKFALSSEWAKIPQAHSLACAVHLCEKSTRGFFRRWAIFTVADSMFDRLPVLCRDAIFELLPNKDLRTVVMAGDPDQNEYPTYFSMWNPMVTMNLTLNVSSKLQQTKNRCFKWKLLLLLQI